MPFTRRTAAIVVNWNKHELTSRCIDSLKRSETQCHIIVVDNGSSSDNIEVLKKISGIELIKSKENIGFGRGNNLGIRWALSNTDCKHIFLLNNDATVMPDTIGHLEEALSSYPETGMVSPRIAYTHDPSILWYGGGEIAWYKGGAVTPGSKGPVQGTLAMSERYVTFASGCSMLIRRDVFETIGGFDPRLFLYEEDIELCLRVLEAQWKIRYIPLALVHHDVQGSLDANIKSLTMFDPDNPRLYFFFFHRTKNKLLTFSSHAKGLHFIQFWLCFPAYWALKCFFLLLHGKWGVLGSVAKGISVFLKDSNIPFRDELKMEPK
jgi:hypothetical protein